MSNPCARVFNVPGPKGPTGGTGTNGTDGKSAFTTLLSGFTMPAVGGTVVAEVADATWIIPSASVGLPGEVDGHVLVVQFAGSFLATAIVDATHVTLYNLGYLFNAPPASAIPAGAAVAPGGAQGSSGGSGGGSGANPTARVGLTAVDGVATTFLRSDGAPPIDQSIAPTWTGLHTWDLGGGLAILTANGDVIASKTAGGDVVSIARVNPLNDALDFSGSINSPLTTLGTFGYQQLVIPRDVDLINGDVLLCDIMATGSSTIGGRIIWTIIAEDGGTSQVIHGTTSYAAALVGGVWTKDIVATTVVSAITAGTLTAAFALVDGVDKVTLKVTPATSLTPSKFKIMYHVENDSLSRVVIL